MLPGVLEGHFRILPLAESAFSLPRPFTRLTLLQASLCHCAKVAEQLPDWTLPRFRRRVLECRN